MPEEQTPREWMHEDLSLSLGHRNTPLLQEKPEEKRQGVVGFPEGAWHYLSVIFKSPLPVFALISLVFC